MTPPRMRLLFLGSGEFGLPTLRELALAHDVVGIVSQPDRGAGRSQKLTPTPIAEWAGTHLPGVPLFKPESVNDPEIVAALRALDAEAMVVIAFGQKIGPGLLSDRFAINLHASLLPRWRGAAPIHRAILAGDTRTGNSVITLADRMDAGLVLGQSERAITPDLSAGALHDLLAADGPALVLRVLDEHRRGVLRGVAQDPALVTTAPKLSKADGWLDFSGSSEACALRVRGLSPWPGVTVKFRDEPLRLLRVESADPSSQQSGAGMIVDAVEGIVACGSGTRLRLVEVQPAGARAMSWPEFARGRRVLPDEPLQGGRSC